MTPYESMIQGWYKALEIGGGKLIKNGIGFATMTIMLGLSLWAIVYLLDTNKSDRAEFKAEIREMKVEHSEQLNDLRRQIASCDMERRELAVKVAELTVMVNRKLKR